MSRLMILASFCFWLAAAHGQVSEPTGTSRPPLTSFYGVPWEADSLGNLQIGKTVGRMVSYRFRAEQSAKIDHLIVYLVYRAPGYFSGDGGQVLVQLQGDDGSNDHLPSGTTLASCLIKEPMANRRDRGFPQIRFDKDVQLQKGKLYHFVFTNPAFDPVNNYVSIDDLYHNRRHPSVNLAAPDLDLAVMYKYSDTAKWEHNTGHTPIFSLFFANGTSQGQGYMDARSQSVLTKVAGETKAWEVFKVTGKDRLATAVNIRLRKTGSPGELSLMLEEEGKAIWAGTLPAANVPAEYDWVRLELDKPLTLTKDKVYRLLLSAPAGDAYEVFPLQKGGQYGFDTPNMFKDGYFDSTSGPRSLVDKHDMDMQFYFELN